MITEKRLSPKEAEIIEQYYIVHYDQLFKYAYHILHDQSLAEVAVQETFLVASRRVDKLIESERPIGWLFNVLKYTIKAMERDRAEILRRCVELDDTVVPSEELPEPEELDKSNCDLALLKRVYVDGYRLSELAAELNTTVPALKMRISRAKKRLREDPQILSLHDFEA